MKLGVNNLSSSVRLALSLGAVMAMGVASTAFAQDASTTSTDSTSSKDATKLQTVVVTGSLIRRVDTETASPVVTIDRAQIQATGKATLGDLVQDLPAMTGGNTNPQVNNGGGAGSSTINLRGLGANRTLILVDGQRVVSSDVNSIPANAIERIDVQTEGASATYGSDAIGGVVNFILRKDYQGAQFTTNVGQSDHNDGEQHGYSFVFGQTGDKGSIMAGVDYNQQDGVEAGNRKFSKNSISISGSTGTPPATYVGGSSSAPYGHIQLPGVNPDGSYQQGSLAAQFGCGTVALNPGGNSSVATKDNYHCFTKNDKYNYATVNLILTPQERTNAFVMGTYNLGENVQAYMDAYYNKTSANFQLAPGILGLPPYASGNFTISANNYWNPFGVDYSPSSYNYTARLAALGDRRGSYGTETGQVITGVKGNFQIADQEWNWNLGYNYGHISQTETVSGLPNIGDLYMGASHKNADGTLGCGTAAAPTTCPNGVGQTQLGFNPFDLYSAGSIAALQAAASPALENSYTIERTWHADVNGGVFDLPAGTVQLAAGADYRRDYYNSVVDPVLQINGSSCTLGSQCSSNMSGGYNVKEVYAETLIPVLANLPGIQSLNLDIGDRYSRFSSFGSTNNFKFAVEWKPFNDLLLRGTMAEVFRAPNIGEVYDSPASDSPKLSSDPCDGYTGNPVNPACVNVPVNVNFKDQAVAEGNQITAVESGSAYAGFPIKPETGKSFDFGAVYSPSWAPGLSATVDAWRIYLLNTITTVGAQNVLNLCAAGQTQFCSLITRYASGPQQGQIETITEPTANLGTVNTAGIDWSLLYKLPAFSFGRFTAGLNGTYLKQYDQQTAPGTSSNVTYHDAGHFLPYGSAQQAACYGSGTCLFPRWKGQGYLDWQLGDWSAEWRMRYIGRFTMGSKSPSQDVYPYGICGTTCTLYGAELKYGATVYNDFSFGYNIVPLNTRIDFGVNNAFDKQPPMLYANNTVNANTDPSDFDLMGRYYWARVTVKF